MAINLFNLCITFIEISLQLQNITSVKYSNFRHSVLGSSGESGNVALWDCNSNKLMQNFTEHNAPSTGLAFSPVNDVSQDFTKLLYLKGFMLNVLCLRFNP